MRISDWSSDVCSSDLFIPGFAQAQLMRNPSSIVAMKLLVVGRCHSDDGDERTHVIARSCIRHKNVYQTVVDALPTRNVFSEKHETLSAHGKRLTDLPKQRFQPLG